MKSILRVAVIVLAMLPAISFAQTKKAVWAEAKKFHSFMSSSFHPTEEGNFAPLRKNADSMYIAAKAWQSSPIPDNYKPEETKKNLEILVNLCADISKEVKAKASDETLKKHIIDAHDAFHKLMGECKKED